MKNNYFYFTLLLALGSETTSGQLVINSINPSYNLDAPAQISADLIEAYGTGIGYEVKKGNGNSIALNGCSVVWTATYGIMFPATGYTNSSQKTSSLTNNSNQGYIRWVNDKLSCTTVNGVTTCVAKGKINVSYTGSSCEVSGQTATKDVNVKFVGKPGAVSINGYTNPANVGCGAQNITLTAVAAQNATHYDWQNIPAAWTGSRTTTTNSATFQVNAGTGATSIYPKARRADVPDIKTNALNSVNVVRPSVTINNTTPNSDILLCSSSSRSFSASGTNADKFEWAPSANVRVNGSSSPQLIFGSVNISAVGSGSFTVKAFSTLCAKYSDNTPIIRHVSYGQPAIAGSGQYLFEPTTNLWKCYINPVQFASPLWSLVSGDASFGSTNQFDPYISSVNGGTVQVVLTNTCGSSSAQYFSIPAAAGMLITYPNPASHEVTIQFKNVSAKEFLPQTLLLYNEKTQEKVRSVDVGQLYSNKMLIGNKLVLDVKYLPRGTYLLHIIPQEGSKQKVDQIRLKLE